MSLEEDYRSDLSANLILPSEPPRPHERYYEYHDSVYDYENIGPFPLPGVGLERFLPLLPVEQLRVSLAGGEGDTPVSRIDRFGVQVGFTNLWVKHEERNPTGCFKDRESAVVISQAMERGERRVVVSSSGNAALSTAAYAQKAGLECVCFVPESTSDGKQHLIELYGAELVTHPGFYEQVYRHVVDNPPVGLNVTTGQNEARTEANKTIAYELWEQIGVPDTIVVPCGNGGCLAGIWKGFKELKKLGKIDKLPQMVAVQVKDASPFSAAMADGSEISILGEIQESIAEGIVAQESYASVKAMRALRESGGYVVEVTDEEILDALIQIIQTESLTPEPTSASAFAAVSKLKNKPDDLITIINTGNGAKVIEEIIGLIRKRKLHE